LILLDTHVLVWLLGGDSRLGKKALRAIETATRAGEVSVSAMSFWEIALLVDARRLRLPGSADDFRGACLRAGIREVPVDGSMAIRSTRLTALEGDPVDRIVVATALERDLRLVTGDARILGMRGGPARIDARR
jgi:PIN domain nuclease of toxin-antitoxin system